MAILLHLKVVVEIYIRKNFFKGDPKFGIFGEFATNIVINDNAFRNPKPTVEHINFIRKNRNISHWNNWGIDKSKCRDAINRVSTYIYFTIFILSIAVYSPT